jgi:hypothetical protein
MIKKLKYKFVLINMALITIVLVVIFISVYASTQQRLINDSMGVLERALMKEDHAEPFRFTDATPKARARLLHALHSAGFQCVDDGRF